jgi:aspartyl-tRNA(Asn)/glutamyl-tRNA(Gln) amidotransferase subunit B
MVDPEVKKQYAVTVGIECHVQLKTKTKLFSAVGNDAREAPPNTLVSHIDFGMPGALPVLNKEAVHLASRAAFALDTVPQKYSYFERKHYFYPDLPMGYQISQLDHPIIVGGTVEIEVEGRAQMVRINRVQIEADAGKSTHPVGKDYSLVDLNRVGTPLLEIVSEPDIHSAAQARAYVRELYLRMRYADVSDANLYYGNMRFDVNVSVSKTEELGTRTETKNLNSFRAVEKTVEYEVNRQIERLEKGETIVQETRGWDDAKQATFSQRTKENADDYRYMPDPDLPPVILDDAYIESIRQEMPVMPTAWRERLKSLGLTAAHTETLLEAHVEVAGAGYLDLLQEALTNPEYAKQLANWLVNIDIPLMREQENAPTVDRSALYAAVEALVRAGKLSSTNAKALISELLLEGTLPSDIAAHAEAKGLVQVSDESELTQIVADVLAANQKAADDVKAGEMKAIGFLVGQVMKQSQGKANPGLAADLIKKQLGI